VNLHKSSVHFFIIIFKYSNFEKEQSSHQILIPRLPRRSRQNFITENFFRAHKSWTGFHCTSSAVSASVSRYASVSNLAMPYQVVYCFIVLQTHTHRFLNNPCMTERCNNQTLSSIQWKQTSASRETGFTLVLPHFYSPIFEHQTPADEFN
jgi:hypothetical protein